MAQLQLPIENLYIRIFPHFKKFRLSPLSKWKNSYKKYDFSNKTTSHCAF